MTQDTTRILRRLTALSLTIACAALPACNTDLTVPPFGTIAFSQMADKPNFTVAFDAEGAVNNASRVSQVNWVFGDGTGFVPGGLQIEHQYAAAGTYNVTTEDGRAAGRVSPLFNLPLPRGRYLVDLEGRRLAVDLKEGETRTITVD